VAAVAGLVIVGAAFTVKLRFPVVAAPVLSVTVTGRVV
jgi:hypothetical protein